MIVTLSAINQFIINLIPINRALNRALKQLLTIIDRFVMTFKVWKLVGVELMVILMAFTL